MCPLMSLVRKPLIAPLVLPSLLLALAASMVPMISNLKESININNNVFITQDPQNTNIVFYKNSTVKNTE